MRSPYGNFFLRLLRLLLHSLLFAPLIAHGQGVTREVQLMGTMLTVTVTDPRGAEGRVAEQAIQAVEEAEGRLSTWKGTSELSQVNSLPIGHWLPLSPLLCSELKTALFWAEQTHGAFDPTVGALVEAYQLRLGGRWPSAELRGKALARTGWRFVEIEACRLRKHAPITIEEGGFGKGAALDAALQAVAGKTKEIILNFGGQVAFNGPERDVAIRHPANPERVVARWRVPPGSVATSGNGIRGRWIDGQFLGHILDPRLGLPAKDFGSVSVWAAGALAADCLSTALFVLGPKAGMAWLASQPSVQAVFLEIKHEGLQVIATPGALKNLQIVDPVMEAGKKTSKGEQL